MRLNLICALVFTGVVCFFSIEAQAQGGCTDQGACNFDPNAQVDDGSCAFDIDCAGICGGSFILDLCGNCYDPSLNIDTGCPQGCTDPEACNYDPDAEFDDGSCQVPPQLDLGSDITLCEGDSVLIDAGAGWDSYLWSTGDQGQSISVNTTNSIEFTGTYGATESSNNYSIFCNNGQYVDIQDWTPTSSYTLGGLVKFPLLPISEWRTMVQYGSGYHHILFSPQGELGLYNGSFSGVGVNQSSLSAGYHHIAIVASGNSTNFYIDGSFVGAVNTKVTQPVGILGNHVIGHQPIGHMDNLSLWNYALSPEEIAASACEPPATAEGLVAFWNFEEGQGGTVLDISGNGYHGTIIGASYSQDLPDLTCSSSCAYSDTVEVIVASAGCTNPAACNYDAEAGCDDGSCILIAELAALDLGDDITLCQGDSALLSVPFQYDNYEWSTGQMDSAIVVTESGTIELTVGVETSQPISNDGAASVQSGQVITIPDWQPGAEYTLAGQVSFPLPPATYNTLFVRDNGVYHHVIIFNSVLGLWNDGFVSSGFNVNTLAPGYHHIAAVAFNNQTDFYIDGNLVATSPARLTQTIGALGNHTSPTQPMGLVDELQIWNYALTADEINEVRNCRPAFDSEGLVAFWSMDEIVNGVIPDLTGNGYDGTVSGGLSISSNRPELNCDPYCYATDSIQVEFLLTGCTNPEACNYDAGAGCDDGSCAFAPEVNLGEDFVGCQGDSLVLTAPAGFDYYRWNGIQGDESLNVTESGQYVLEGVVGNELGNNERSLQFQSFGEYMTVPSWSPTPQSSLCAWVKFPLQSSNNGWRTLFKKSGDNDHHVIVDVNGELGLFTNGFSASSFNVNTLTAGWHHLAAITSSGQTMFYIDGEQVGSVNTVVTAPVEVIGNHNLYSQEIGGVDEVSIWQKALSSEELSEIIQCTPAVDDPDLIAFYRFEEIIENEIHDSSPNQRHGQLINGLSNTDAPQIACATICSITDTINILLQESGCTDPLACNYSENAVCDDGSCVILPSFSLGPDASICHDDSLTLDAGSEYDYYIWSTGDSTQSVTIRASELIEVTAGFGSFETPSNAFALVGSGTQVVTIPSWSTPDQFTLGAWVKFPLPSGNTYHTLFERIAGDYHHILFNPQGELGVYETPNFYSCGLNESQIPDGWHQIMAVAQNNQTDFYLDGYPVGTAAVQVSGNVEIIGGHTTDPQPIGFFDEVQMWSVALSPQGVAQYAQCTPTGEEEGLLAVFNASEGNGTTLFNSVPQGFNGQLQGINYTEDAPELACLPLCAVTDTIQVWKLGSGIGIQDSTICIGSSIDLSIEALPDSALHFYEILWSTGEQSDSIQVQPQTDQSITVTLSDESASCLDSIMVYVNDPQLDIQADTLSFCSVDSVLIEAPDGFELYQWSHGSTAQNPWVQSSGTYSLTVSDTVGCQSIDSVLVSLVNATILPGDTTICFSDSIMLELVDLSAFEELIYFNDFSNGAGALWSTAQTTSIHGEQALGRFSNGTVSFNMNNLPSHDSLLVEFTFYPLDSWDGILHGELFEVYVDEVSVLSTGFSSFNHPQCYPDNCPASNPAGTGSDQTVAPICHPTQSFRYQIARTVPHSSNSVVIDFEALGLQDLCDESWALDNFRLSSISNRSYSSVVWSDETQSDQLIVSPDSTTTYTVEYTDGITACIDSVAITVSDPQPYFTSDSLIICGEEPYEIGLEQQWSAYDWSTGESSETIQTNSSGWYSVEIADSVNCSATDSIHLYFTQMQIEQDDMAICKGDTVFLSISDVLPSVNWSTEDVGNQLWVTPVADSLITATYVEGLRNCTDSVLIQVSDMAVSLETTSVSCYGLDDGTAELDVVGGIQPYIVDWSGADPQALEPGVVELFITDSVQCVFDSTFVISQPEPLVAAGFAYRIQCDDSLSGQLAYTAAGGTEPYTSQWPLGSDHGYAEGEYTWTVIDGNGCEDTIHAEVLPSLDLCGCTYEEACNYDPAATSDDGSCTYPEEGFDCEGNEVCAPTGAEGCTYEDACNYDPAAETDNGTCTYPLEGYDCAGTCIADYNNNGVCDLEEITGCTYENGFNYDPAASVDDGNCNFSCTGDFNGDQLVNSSDLLNFLGLFGSACP